MPISQVLSACHLHADSDCHGHHHVKAAYPRLMEAMAKVSFIGLSVLAAATSLQLFVPAFVVGAVYGFYERCNSGMQQAKKMSFGGCSQGMWEDFASIKFPLPVALLAGVTAAAVHIDHHPIAFVPLAGFAFGAWVGSTCAPAVSLGVKKLRHFANI